MGCHFYTLSSFLIICFISFIFPLHVEPATLSITTDKESLLSLRSSLGSDLIPNPLSNWDQTSTPCNWTGVLCNKSGRRVVGLDLSGFGLFGSISPHIGNLSFLHSINLQNNRFTGPIPHEITNLSRLRVLNMSFNLIQGVIPPNVSHLTELQVLDLMSNRVTGEVPEELSHLTRLEILKLGRNIFNGKIPHSLANLSSLTVLNLGTNSLGGSIPSEIGHLHNLVELDLSVNNLTGHIPSSIYNLSSLAKLSVGSNQLSGEIPYDVGHKLPNLLVFIFCVNHFTGRIPGSLHNLTRIQVLRMSHNSLSGTVPPGLGNLPSLEMYIIGHNNIVSSGDEGLSFLSSLANSTKLTYLAIDSTLLEGVIPHSIGNLSKGLLKLYMGGNRLYGEIPSSIGHLKSLTLLNLSSNLISGEIPPQISQLEELQMLGLGNNRISGVIPSSLGNLRKLYNIDLSGNSLRGYIPSSFGGFQNLLSMDLSNNRLNGSIPEQSLYLPSLSTTLNLSNNFLSGALPKGISLLEKVITIDLSNNLLSGNVPSSIKNCKSLEALFMANNRFSGPIPATLGEMKGLQVLDLSSNQLSGNIPDDLQMLQALKYLNLSFNALEGRVPRGGVFRNISHIHLEGNEKLCLSSRCLNVGGAHRRRILKLRFVVIILSTLALCSIVGLVLLYLWKRKAKTKQVLDPVEGKYRMISYEELRNATRNFSQENLSGSGGFGSVYKGQIEDGIVVAVKVLDTRRTGSWKSFVAECEALRNIRHRNLVRLITSCSSIDFKNQEFLALVYEYLGNGSLEDWMRGKRRKENGSALNLVERMMVAIDVACALDYMHHDCVVPVVHCDIKPSNILLEEDMTAKVGDFGLARLLMENRDAQTSISSAHALKGSIGYIPPEYGIGEKPSTAGDAYSFGVMLLELFTGRSPTDESFNDELNLPRWVQSSFLENIVQVVDPELVKLGENLYNEGQYLSRKKQFDCLTTVLEIGLSSTTSSPNERMNMRNALHELKAAKENLLRRAI